MKRSRQNKILELISQYEIETQEDLAKLMLEAGFQVTQATISRDIRELALTKVSGRNGKPKYAVTEHGGNPPPAYSDRYTRVLQDGIMSIVQAGSQWYGDGSGGGSRCPWDRRDRRIHRRR